VDDIIYNPEFDYKEDVNKGTIKHKVSRIFAEDGFVCVEAEIDGKDHVQVLSRCEAIQRAIAINEMVSMMQYNDERDNAMKMVQDFMTAINQAKLQDGDFYRSKSVNMAVNISIGSESDKGIIVGDTGNNKCVGAHTNSGPIAKPTSGKIIVP